MVSHWFEREAVSAVPRKQIVLLCLRSSFRMLFIRVGACCGGVHDVGVLWLGGRGSIILVSYPCVRRWMHIPATRDSRERCCEASLDRAATAGGSAPDMLSSHQAADARARHHNGALQRLRAGDTSGDLRAMQLLSQSPRSRLEVERGPSVVTWWSADGRAGETGTHPGETGTHHWRALPTSTVHARLHPSSHPSIVTWSLFVPLSTRLGAQSAGARVVESRERKAMDKRHGEDKRHAQTAPPHVHPAPQDELLGCGGGTFCAQKVHSDIATQENMPGDGGEGEGVCAGSAATQASPLSTSSSISSPSLVTQLCVPPVKRLVRVLSSVLWLVGASVAMRVPHFAWHSIPLLGMTRSLSQEAGVRF